MKQLNKNQMNLFARAIMPELYRLQKKYDSRSKPLGGVCRLTIPDDQKALMSLALKNSYKPNKQQLDKAA